MQFLRLHHEKVVNVATSTACDLGALEDMQVEILGKLTLKRN